MKNLFLLPTDKPSRLAGSEYITNEQGIDKRAFKLKLWDKLIPNKDLKDVGYIPQNIYITNDEPIKEGWKGYAYKEDVEGKVFKHFYTTNEWYKDAKKIILTTDQDLIADGVQAIDDEFLEWFVKNPSCESVEVDIYSKKIGIETDANGYREMDVFGKDYKVIIPQEEPKQETSVIDDLKDISNLLDKMNGRHQKQETLEEAAFRLYPRLINDPYNPMEDDNKENRDIWIAGTKYQSERMYSEEEVLDMLEVHKFLSDYDYFDFGQWFEQFKKKA
jgi:hypothetical protein